MCGEGVAIETLKELKNKTTSEKCCYGDSNPSRGRERPA
jgi:hypothetical protein